MQLEAAPAHFAAQDLLGLADPVRDRAAGDMQLVGHGGDAALVFEGLEQRLAERGHRIGRGGQWPELAADEVAGAGQVLGEERDRGDVGVVGVVPGPVAGEPCEPFGPSGLFV